MPSSPLPEKIPSFRALSSRAQALIYREVALQEGVPTSSSIFSLMINSSDNLTPNPSKHITSK